MSEFDLDEERAYNIFGRGGEVAAALAAIGASNDFAVPATTSRESGGAAGTFANIPVPAVQKSPNGRTFDEITGTGYLSDDEELWYWMQRDPSGASWPERLKEKQAARTQEVAGNALGKVLQVGNTGSALAAQQGFMQQQQQEGFTPPSAVDAEGRPYGRWNPPPGPATGVNVPKENPWDVPVVSPFLRDVVQPVAGEAASRVASLTPAGQAWNVLNDKLGLGGPSSGEVASFGAKGLVPVTGPEIALEFVPGIGTVPGTASAVRKLGREALEEAVPAFTRTAIGAGERLAEDVVRAGKLLEGGEEGALRLPSLPGAAKQAETIAPPPSAAAPPVPTPRETWNTLESANLTGEGASTMFRKVAEVAANVPGVARLEKTLFGPAALARSDPALRAGVTYKLMEQAQGGELVGKLARFEGDMPFDVADAGKIKLGSKDVAFGDVAENPTRHALTSRQRQFIEDGWQYVDDFTSQYTAVTGKVIDDAEADVWREHFWPRFMEDESGGVTIKRPIGIKQSPVLDRLYDTMEDGIAAGLKYASPVDTLRLYGQAMQKMTRDEVLKQVIREQKIGRSVTDALTDKIAELRNSPIFLTASTPEEIDAAKAIWTRIQRLEHSKSWILEARRGEKSGYSLGPSFSNVVFPKENFDKLASILGTAPGKPGFIGTAASMANNASRFVVTGALDVGQLMINGLTLLGGSQSSWAEGVGRSIQALAAPRAYRRWLANSPDAQRAMAHGVNPGFGASDLTEASLFGPVRSLPLVGSRGFASIPRAFDGFLGGARIHKFNAMMRASKTPEFSDEAYRIARYVDTLVGTPNLAGLGVSQGQRAAEAMWIAYSPRYTRSIIGMLGHAFGKGATATDARWSLATMAAAGAATFYGAGKAMGMDDDEILERLNPQSGSKFMSLRVGDNEYGIGGIYRATVEMMGALTRHDTWEWDKWGGDDTLNNPLVRYLRNRTTPVTGSIIDFINGEDFMGREASLAALFDDPAKLGDYAFDKFTPQTLQAVLEARGDWDNGALSAAVSAIGSRTNPISASTLATEAIENKLPYQQIFPPKIAGGLEGLTLDQFGPRERAEAYKWLEQNDPDVYKERIEDRRARGNVFQEASDKQDAAFERHSKELDGLFSGLKTGDRKSVEQVLERADDIRNIIRGANEEIRSSKEYKDAVAGLESNDINRLLDYWYGLPEKFKKANGTTDWDKVEAEQRRLINAARARDPLLADRLVYNTQGGEAQHQLFQLIDYVNKASDDYYAQPEGVQRNIWLNQHPDVNVARWLLGYNSLYSAEAYERAKQLAPGRTDLKVSSIR